MAETLDDIPSLDQLEEQYGASSLEMPFLLRFICFQFICGSLFSVWTVYNDSRDAIEYCNSGMLSAEIIKQLPIAYSLAIAGCLLALISGRMIASGSKSGKFWALGCLAFLCIIDLLGATIAPDLSEFSSSSRTISGVRGAAFLYVAFSKEVSSLYSSPRPIARRQVNMALFYLSVLLCGLLLISIVPRIATLNNYTGPIKPTKSAFEAAREWAPKDSTRRQQSRNR